MLPQIKILRCDETRNLNFDHFWVTLALTWVSYAWPTKLTHHKLCDLSDKFYIVLSSAAAGEITYRIHCSIDSVAQAAFYAYPNTMTNTSSYLETVDVSWITWVNCSFRMKAISPKLGSDTWHSIIYTFQNNFKSSSTTQNWRKLQHAAILSCWRHLCMLRL